MQKKEKGLWEIQMYIYILNNKTNIEIKISFFSRMRQDPPKMVLILVHFHTADNDIPETG